MKLTRRKVLAGMAGAAIIGSISMRDKMSEINDKYLGNPSKEKRARAITMWDFSWIERRWDGAGYEDWDKILDELGERGYDAIRIDAFPHLIHFAPEQEILLKPVWNQQVWGSPDLNRINVFPAILEFIEKCRYREFKVVLSSWYREDEANTRMKIQSAEIMAQMWLDVLDRIRKAGLLDTILYVDFCNEWPGNLWAPFLTPGVQWGEWHAAHSLKFIKESIELVRHDYPELPLLYSFDNDRVENYLDYDVSFFDLFEHHIWAVKENNAEFYQLTKYEDGRFNPKSYENLSLLAEKTYRARPEYWTSLLASKIDRIAEVSRQSKKPLSTTESWGIVDYKDWPLLDWEWVKELCEFGTLRAVESGRWLTVCTSNFCGPQFVGMWRDVAWHQKLTTAIKNTNIASDLKNGRVYSRL